MNTTVMNIVKVVTFWSVLAISFTSKAADPVDATQLKKLSAEVMLETGTASISFNSIHNAEVRGCFAVGRLSKSTYALIELISPYQNQMTSLWKEAVEIHRLQMEVRSYCGIPLSNDVPGITMALTEVKRPDDVFARLAKIIKLARNILNSK